MAVILLTTFSNAYYRMKIFVIWLKFHCVLFTRVQLIIRYHWFRYWLGTEQAHISVTRPRPALNYCSMNIMLIARSLTLAWINLKTILAKHRKSEAFRAMMLYQRGLLHSSPYVSYLKFQTTRRTNILLITEQPYKKAHFVKDKSKSTSVC